MNEEEFEGTLVLERLAEIGRVDEFLELVDADDFEATERLLRSADLDAETIAIVLAKVRDPGDQH